MGMDLSYEHCSALIVLAQGGAEMPRSYEIVEA